MRNLVAKLPWYDPETVEKAHEHSEAVHQRSIDVRKKAEAVTGSRAYGDLTRLEHARNSRRG